MEVIIILSWHVKKKNLHTFVNDGGKRRKKRSQQVRNLKENQEKGQKCTIVLHGLTYELASVICSSKCFSTLYIRNAHMYQLLRKKFGITIHMYIFCYQIFSDLLWVKIVLVNFWSLRLKAQHFWDHWNNLIKQWKVGTIFGNRMFLNLFLEVYHI